MTTGKIIAAFGAVLLLLGLALSYAPWLVSWFGKLPGDIRLEKENSLLFVPITSMIVISLILSVFGRMFFRG